MVEELRCPQCGSSIEGVKVSGSAVCPGCGTVLGATSERPGSSTALPQRASANEADAPSGERGGHPSAKYCPRCGARLEMPMRFCDRCGANHAGLSSPDGRCHWCGLQSSAESELCENCGARLITVCPQCQSRMKAGLNYCAWCGLDYQQLLQDQDSGDQEQENSER